MRNVFLIAFISPLALCAASCGTLGGSIDQPAAAAVRAEVSTFEALVPVVFTFVVADVDRPIDERAAPAGRLTPEGRTDAELGNLLGLLSDWSFRLELNASAAGVEVPVGIPPDLDALKTALELPAVVSTGRPK